MEKVYGSVSFVCHSCEMHLQKGMLSSVAVADGLQLLPVPENLELSELANNLTTQKILFQKIFQLPKSRIVAVKGKLVNIPFMRMFCRHKYHLIHLQTLGSLK